MSAAYPAALALLLAAWLALLPGALVRLRGRMSTNAAWLLAAILLAALSLRLAPGGVHLVYNDEFEHLDIARRLAASGTFAGQM